MRDLFRKKSIEQIKADAAAGMLAHDPGEVQPGTHLKRSLGLFDLTMLGIAAIIGAGIFAMVGEASHDGGPAVIFLFVFSAIACGFAALCYAEFASRIPIAGSAYTYTYASMGELIAWIIGWDLIVEYAIGNIAVAISWSDYFTGMLRGYGVEIPAYLTMDYLTASRSFEESQKAIEAAIGQGHTLEAMRAMSGDSLGKISEDLSPKLVEAYSAWSTAPVVGGWHVVVDLPALMITFVITALVYIGIRESKFAANVMTVLKIGIILMVIGLGFNYVQPENWSPFAPNGVEGVLKGVAGVFFAYIGFDALATTAEEAKDPHKDLPRAMILSLVICTVLYVALALVLTGMVSYQFLNVGDPLAFVFGPEGANIPWLAQVIAISAVIALGTVFLVFQLGQPRLWMAMSRDGLLPKIFSSIHPKFHTPWFATIVTGLVVAIPALFMNLEEVTDLTAIGTLFAFVLVCAGVLVKDREFEGTKRFVPYIGSRFILTPLLIAILAVVYYFNPSMFSDFFSLVPAEGEGAWGAFSHKIPLIIYLVVAILIVWLSLAKNISLIPCLGLLSCAYLMTELGVTNWARFGLWLLAGLVIYFLYGYRNSNLNKGNGVPSSSDSAPPPPPADLDPRSNEEE
ncbi:MAG: amino acid permease [Acidobacteria bacterium]|nr:MAG: amino acid permease [Acidobacteriota bacterium]REJ98351.1 MAG: amino acid permease [Acidobacteriota bacterium]REK17095.1 MAG: amino acid permease [Acidobacteriota bacterium]REK43005.1 MAG: amino acid permease [Acidobacteriota bacterium]